MTTARGFLVAAMAARWHAGQTRRYTGEPYIIHPLSVAAWMELLDGPVEVALLHDVMEDCGVSLGQLREFVGWDIAEMVEYLTNPFTKTACPGLNRAQRNRMARERWARFGRSPNHGEGPPHQRGEGRIEDTWKFREASLVKLADLLDNAMSIKAHDADFWPVYRQEALDWIEVLYVRSDEHQALLKKLMEVLG